MLSPLRAAAAVLIAVLAAGCAATPGRTTPDDRWEGFNRGVYKFNAQFDRYVYLPVVRAYDFVDDGLEADTRLQRRNGTAPALFRVDPATGKGVKYDTETILRKEGKKK